MMHHNSQKLEEIVENKKLRDDICGFNLLSFLNELSYNSGISRKLKLKPSGFYREKNQFSQTAAKSSFCTIFTHQIERKMFFLQILSKNAVEIHYKCSDLIRVVKYIKNLLICDQSHLSSSIRSKMT